MKKASSSTKKGLIVKGIGGFYYVRMDEGDNDNDSHQQTIVCKARGLFRKNGMTPMIGDEVLVSLQKDNTGYLEEILPRFNEFVRPPVANIDQIAVVMALADPEPNMDILDKFIVSAEKNEVEILLIFNKIDIAEAAVKERFLQTYELLYPVYFVCGKTGDGVGTLKDALYSKKTAFAGPSGSGKSTLINLLAHAADMETGDVSEKTGRGKHTTRHVELIQTDFGAILLDTPGFTSFEITEMEIEELELYFPEIERLRSGCRFKGCSHMSEPGCMIKKALAEGRLHQSRYDSYARQYKTLQEQKKRY